MTITIQNVVIDGQEIEIKAGMYLKLDAVSYSRMLLNGDNFCPFRLESYAWFQAHGEVNGPACRIEITGRKINWRTNSVRCQVVFLGDGEPDERCPAVLFLGKHF